MIKRAQQISITTDTCRRRIEALPPGNKIDVECFGYEDFKLPVRPVNLFFAEDIFLSIARFSGRQINSVSLSLNRGQLRRELCRPKPKTRG